MADPGDTAIERNDMDSDEEHWFTSYVVWYTQKSKLAERLANEARDACVRYRDDPTLEMHFANAVMAWDAAMIQCQMAAKEWDSGKLAKATRRLPFIWYHAVQASCQAAYQEMRRQQP